MTDHIHSQVLVIGSGAGGATTAVTLASEGMNVTVLEEGRKQEKNADFTPGSIAAMRSLYRHRGMTPIMGSVPIGFVEGCCLGGSTEINSGFWHRLPPEIALRWKAQFGLEDMTPENLNEHFVWAENQLEVGLTKGELPESSRLFARGIERMGWSSQEVPRVANAGDGESQSENERFLRQGVSNNLIPQAEEKNVRFFTGCRVIQLVRKGRRITGVIAERSQEDGTLELVRIDADYVFVAAGAVGTPDLLRRSGIKFHIGDSLRIHPMLKVTAKFDRQVDAQESALPLLQVKEFWPDISLGGAYFSLGHLALLLSDNWPEWMDEMNDYRNLASYYIAVRGTGRGSVRPSVLGEGRPAVRYELSQTDLNNLSVGLARLSMLLMAAGAREVYPSIQGMGSMKTKLDAVRWLDTPLPRSSISLTTVHSFSSCPAGERKDRCAVDSYGKVYGFDNLFINDASMIPDSPGINPQGTIMAMARRNALYFTSQLK